MPPRYIYAVLLVVSMWIGFPGNARFALAQDDDDDDHDENDFPIPAMNLSSSNPNGYPLAIKDPNITFDDIVGGVTAGKHEFPFAAAIFELHVVPGVGVRSMCSGSLIHPRAVLTAAHCIGEGAIGPGSWVYIGQQDLDGLPNGDKSAKVRVARAIIHPGYSSIYFENGNDIALLILEYPVGIQPVQIETSSNITAEINKEKATAIGYGQISFPDGPEARFLQKVTEPLYPICQCYHIMHWQAFESSTVASKQLCYYPPTTVRRVCFGDSGGPLLTGSDLDNFKVRGTVSFGEGCNQRLPDIYTRVSAYAGWIDSNVHGGGLSSIGGPTVVLIGVPASEWAQYPSFAQGNRACIQQKWLGGFNVGFSPPGFDFGAMCFNSSVALLINTTATQLNSISDNWRLAASRVCYAQGHLAGVWTGEQYRQMRTVLCLRKNKNAHFVEPLRSDLDALSTDKDRAGYLFASKLGFRFAMQDGSESLQRRNYYLVGSRSFSWNFTYPKQLKNNFVQQTCLPGCPRSCKFDLLGNGVCDSSCNYAECAYDNGDCEVQTVLTAKALGQCQCAKEWRGDHVCDDGCNNSECEFDNGDCTSVNCPSSCQNLLGNGFCDAECNTKDCNFDNADCIQATCKCPLSWLRDGECDLVCNNAACEFDKGDCRVLRR